MHKLSGYSGRFFAVTKVFEVALLAFFVVTAFGIFDFVLPFFTETFSSNMALIGLTVGLLYFGSLIAEVPVGILVDKMGRKTVLLVAVFELSVMGIVYYFTQNLMQLMLLEVIFGVFSVAFWVPSSVLVRDYSPRKMLGKMEGFYLTLSQIGWVIGPIIGGLIASHFNLKANFLMVSAFLLVSFVYGAIVLEKKHFEGGKIMKKVINFVVFKEYSRMHPFSLTLFFLSIVSSIWVGVQWVFIQIATERVFHLSDEMIGFMFAAMMLIEIMLYFPAGYLMDKVGRRYIVTGGFGLLAISALMAFLSKSPLSFFFFMMLCAGSVGWIAPGVEAILTELAAGKKMGEMTGVFDTSKDIGLILGPVLGGVLAQVFLNPMVPFLMVSVAAMLGFLFSFHFWKMSRKYALAVISENRTEVA